MFYSIVVLTVYVCIMVLYDEPVYTASGSSSSQLVAS